MLAGTGVQWGKTRVGAIRMKIAMHSFKSETDAFLITAPTYKIMQQSTLPAFLQIMRGCGTYSKSEAVFTTTWGPVCYFRTGTDPDSVVGITNVRHIWGDEAGKYGLYFWESIQGRSSFCQCPVTLTTSPYALNWIFKELVRPKLKDATARPDVDFISATSAENPYFPREEFERKKMTMDPRRFNAIYGGKWEKMAGLVYDCFDEVDNQCEPFALPPGTQYVASIDWGYTAPFVLKVRAITPEGLHYDVFEFYKTGQTLAQKIDVGRQVKAIFGVSVFYCDPEDPASIAAFNEAKLTAVPAINDIRAGIDVHYELVKSKRYKIFRGTSPYTIDEYESYHYPDKDDLAPDQDEKEVKPVKQGDHCADCARYASMMTKNITNRRPPSTPSEQGKKEDQYERIERLKKRVVNSNTEKWS